MLAGLSITIERVRPEILRMVGRGKGTESGQIPFTPRAKKVFDLTLREALRLGHNYIGTEHLLLGLVRENQGVASRVMLDFGADAATLRAAVLELMSLAPRPRPDEVPPSRAPRGLGGRARPAKSWQDEVTSSLASIIKMLTLGTVRGGMMPRRRARRLAQDAIRRHDPGAEAALGPQAWDALIAEVLDANPDVEAE